jgi:hypothetical protein
MLNTKAIYKNNFNHSNNDSIIYKQESIKQESKQESINGSIKDTSVKEPLIKSYNIKNKSETSDKNNIINITGGKYDFYKETNKEKQNINFIDVNNKLSNRIEWNDEQNSYLIYENNILDCTFNNKDILAYILNSNNGKLCIKKYIFIISKNSNDVNEFNFINSIFTSNFDHIVRLQNFIYDSINNFNSLDIENSSDYQEILLLFYYQLIIWLFKNISIYENNENTLKISKLYSCFCYRFSSLILKNILKIENSCLENNNNIDKLIILKDNILTQINYLNESLIILNQKSDDIDMLQTETSNGDTNTEVTSDNETEVTSDNETEIQSSDENNITTTNVLDKYKIKNKNGKQINKLTELFSDQQISESSDNEYRELSDNEYIELSNKYRELSNMNDTVSSYRNNEYKKESGTSHPTGGISYNINSALNNGKVYKINI